MYYIQKSFEISASHHLTLSYQSKCSNVHGHNWHVTVYCKSKTLNSDGMVADFSEKPINIMRSIISRLTFPELIFVFPHFFNNFDSTVKYKFIQSLLIRSCSSRLFL